MARRGQKTVWVKCSGAANERAFIMLLGDSEGNRSTTYVGFKVKPSKDAAIQAKNDVCHWGFGIRNWKDVRSIQQSTGLEVYANTKGNAIVLEDGLTIRMTND
jgi:hypothetical protein